MKVFFVVFQGESKEFSRWLNIGYLVSSLKRDKDNDVRALFYKFDELEKAVTEILNEDPDMIGIPLMQYNYETSVKLMDMLKEVNPNIHVVVGNSLASTYPTKILEICPSIDTVVYGEGEETLLELCRFISQKKDLKDCKGICYRKDGTIVKNEPREIVQNLDNYLYPDRTFYPNKVNIHGVLGSRGCYANCTFCDINSIFGKGVRIRSITDIIDEVEDLIKNYGCKYVTFHDSTFCVNENDANYRLNQLYEEIITRNLDFSFSLNIRSEQFDNELMEIIMKLKQVGLDYIMIGFEAGNNDDLKFYGKPATVETHNSTLKMLRDGGILSSTYDISFGYGFINFHPFSTMENIKKNIKFLQESGLFVNFENITTRFLNFGNRGIAMKIEREGLLTCDKNMPILDPYAYRFVNSEVERVYNLGVYAEQVMDDCLNIPAADEVLSIYRRWEKFNEPKDNYETTFRNYLMFMKRLTVFTTETLSQIINMVEDNCTDEAIKEWARLHIEKFRQEVHTECQKYNTFLKRVLFDLCEIDQMLYR